MIRAMLFDLDGTLVQTERLKAVSYARAVRELSADGPPEEEILEAYKDLVGLSRRDVAVGLLERFGLEEAARRRMGEFGVMAPWQALVQVRLPIYEQMLADPVLLRRGVWPHNMALLRQARKTCAKVGLATMSGCHQALRVLEVLDLRGLFDFVATADDVEHGKPDPAIYHLLAAELAVEPAQCLVIEDSPSGVRAALAAGTACVAVPTPFTRRSMHASNVLAEQWIVDDPETLPDVVRRRIAAAAEQP
ncbi:MAG: HAD family phosphatase [Deferrisomatales bacterium]|nr:HAD family phosphatase [Deferrisomatales bacterium]